MAIYAFTSDQHIGNYGKNPGKTSSGLNERCRHHFTALRWALLQAEARGAVMHIGCGDLFDYPRTEPQVEAGAQQLFRMTSFRNALIVGNHGQVSNAPGDHALGPLVPVVDWVVDSAVEVVTMPDAEIVLVPFLAGRAEDWLRKTVANALPLLPEKPYRVLVFHLGVSDSQTPYYLDEADDQVCLPTLEQICKDNGITHVFAGNWHKQQSWVVEGIGGREVPVTQVGCTAPNRFTDIDGRFGTMAFLDTETGEVEVIDVPGPRFFKTTTIEQLRNLPEVVEANEVADWVHVSATVLPEHAAEAERLIETIKPYAYEIHFDATAQKTKAYEAIQQAVSTETHHEAVLSYLEGVDIDEDLEDDVIAFVGACMKEARVNGRA